MALGIFVAFSVSHPEKFRSWLRASNDMCEVLEFAASEAFGSESVAELSDLECEVLQSLSDFALRELSKSELFMTQIETPQEILRWFSGFLKENLEKETLLNSKVFSEHRVTTSYDKIIERRQLPSKLKTL